MTEMVYSVDETQDEFGDDKFFVANPDGDWVGEPYPTKEAAYAEARRLNAELIARMLR